MENGQELLLKCKESLGKQLELLTEASKTCKPLDLPKLTEALVLVVREIKS